MKHRILFFLSLLFNILANCFFATMLANRIYVTPIGPKFSTPELLLYLWPLFKNFPCCYTLYNPRNLCWTIRRYRLNEKMYMIAIYAYFQKYYLIPLCYI